MAFRPAYITLHIYQGQTFDDEVNFKDANGDPLDFSDLEARMQVRRAVPDDEVLLELSTEDGTIEPLDETGTVKFAVDADITANLPTDNVLQTWVYDLELYGSGRVTRLMEGSVVVYPEVTRD